VRQSAVSGYADLAAEDGAVPVSARARLALGLVVLAQAERAAISRHGEDGVISSRVAETLNREAQRMREAARASGRQGYLGAAARIHRFAPSFWVALLVQRWLGVRGPLSAALADRFERLLVRRIVIAELMPFCGERIAPVLGERVAALCRRALERRAAGLNSSLGALTLQYPRYAEALEQRFLERVALQEEQRQYRMLHEEGLIGAEISNALDEELTRANRRLTRALRLDLSVDKRALLASQPLFSDLPADTLDSIARTLSTRFVVPAERIITRGERGDTVFFIASGAAEVDTGAETIRLGRGTCVGELAAFSGGRRSADVTMLGYGELLVLHGRAFRRLLSRNEAVRRQVEALVAERGGAAPEARAEPA